MMTDLNEKRLASPWLFFILNFTWTWLFWIPAALLSRSGSSILVTALHFIGGIGPVLAALILVYMRKNVDFKRDYWRRVFDFKRIKARWYIVILLTFPLFTLIPALIDILLSGDGIRLEMAEKFVSQPLMILPFTIFMLFFGPIPEELGWRGYALDGLQKKRNALVASLILGAFWASWHLPLFFMHGTYHFKLGVGTLSFWIFMIEPIFGSILYAWIYNNTNRSTLSAILFHFMGNYMGELFELSGRAEIFQFIAGVAFAIVVVFIWGPKRLKRNSNLMS